MGRKREPTIKIGEERIVVNQKTILSSSIISGRMKISYKKGSVLIVMRNFTMLTDLYQLTMMNGYFEAGIHEDMLVFDAFFRKNPSNGGYTIICGIEQVVDFVENLSFTPEDILYLKTLELFRQDFLDYLEDFRFTGEIYAVEEGTILFPNEPILRVKAPAIQAQLIETAMLNMVNFQSLIATKASRVCYAAGDDPVMEFGLRRAQGPDAGLYGARAAVIGGCVGTSNVMAGQMFGVPILGTQAHSWIQKFPSELEAFRAYAKTYPHKTMLLIDTYNTMASGLPNAITVFDEMRREGHEPLGVRIDSGDLDYLSKQVRKVLDDAGYPKVKITASNDLDEYAITSLKSQGAKIDVWGVGTKLITSSDWPSLGGVYKLSAAEESGKLTPKIKLSEDPQKINNPGYKKLLRIYNKATNVAEADLIALDDEWIDENSPLTIFDPIYTWKKKTYKNYYVKELLKPLFVDGKSVYKRKSLQEIKAYTEKEKASFWPQYLRNSAPERFKVDLSKDLWELKAKLIEEHKHQVCRED